MKKSNHFIFIGLHVIAWIIFVGLCIEAGGLIVNFIYSLVKPEVISRLYQKLDLSDMYRRSEMAYLSIYSLILVIAFLKAYLFYIVIRLLLRLDLAKPFSSYVSEQITKLSYYTFSIGIFSYIARQFSRNLEHRGFNTDILEQFWTDSQAYILMAAVIYVIATIFSKGVELQNENDLTV